MLTPKTAQTTFDEEAVYAEEDLISDCAGLVTVDQHSRVICLVHHTAQVYFNRVSSQIFPNIHLDIAETCITYLGLEGFESDEFTNGKQFARATNEILTRYPFLDYAGKQWGYHARGDPEEFIEERLFRFFDRASRLSRACDILDDTLGIWDFGPVPALTVLIHFGLVRVFRDMVRLANNSHLTCAIRFRQDGLRFILVEPSADWYDSGEYVVRAELSFHQLEGNESFVNILAQNGVPVDLGVDNGEFLFNTSLSRANRRLDIPDGMSTEERKAIPAMLLGLGARFDRQNATNYTDLMCKVVWGHKRNVIQLLKDGVDVNEKNRRGRDALIYTALARHVTVVKPLLEAEADVHSKDQDGMTALCAACKGGNEKIVKLLLNSGADISVQDNYGRTPASIASESGHTPLSRFSDDHGTEGDWKMEREKEDECWDILKKYLALPRHDDFPGTKFIEALGKEAFTWLHDISLTELCARGLLLRLRNLQHSNSFDYLRAKADNTTAIEEESEHPILFRDSTS